MKFITINNFKIAIYSAIGLSYIFNLKKNVHLIHVPIWQPVHMIYVIAYKKSDLSKNDDALVFSLLVNKIIH